MGSDLNPVTSNVSIDEEMSDTMAAINAVMMVLAERCSDDTGNERSMDLHESLLVMAGVAHILFSAIPPDHNQREFDEWIDGVRRNLGKPASGMAIKPQGGRA